MEQFISEISKVDSVENTLIRRASHTC